MDNKKAPPEAGLLWGSSFEVKLIVFFNQSFFDHLFHDAVREPLSRVVIANGSADFGVSYTLRISFHEFKYMVSDAIMSDQRFDLSDGRGHSTVE